jgi:hypothetical protein
MKTAFTALMFYFLTAQWADHGDRFCMYSNGTVLNVGISFCPLSIAA